MMKIFGLVLTLAGSAAADVDPMAILSCQTAYSDYTGDSDCDALVTLAKCFAVAGVDTLPMSDATRRHADDFLAGQQGKAKCYDYEQEGAPAITINDGDMEIDVDGVKDIRIVRYRRDTVSLFDMYEDIQAMETFQTETFPSMFADVEALAQGAADQATENAANLAKKVADDLGEIDRKIASATVALNGKIDAMSQSSNKERATLKQMLEKSMADGVTSAKSATTSALSAQGSSDASKFSALESALAKLTADNNADKKTIDENKPTIVGWHQCEQTGSNGADNSGFVAMTCAYTKKRDDTFMHISVNSNQRQINGNSMWRFQVQSANSGGWRECRGPQNQGNGNIYTRYHGSRGVDLHRPMYVGGVCYRTDNNQPIKKGRFSARWIQTYVHYDSYWNWESSARMILEERTKAT